MEGGNAREVWEARGLSPCSVPVPFACEQRGIALTSPESSFQVVDFKPYGHVAVVLSVARRLGLERLLARNPSRNRALAVAMILARILNPCSKLATAQSLKEHSTGALAEDLGIADVKEHELYRAMDWLAKQQDHIQRRLAKKHLGEGSIMLCDVTSVYFEGAKRPLAKLGYSRDGKRGKPQIVFALLCDAEGRPIAVEVFEGNTADPGVLGSQRRCASASRLSASYWWATGVC